MCVFKQQYVVYCGRGDYICHIQQIKILEQNLRCLEKMSAVFNDRVLKKCQLILGLISLRNLDRHHIHFTC